jgi:polar amino acid transport system substrate-binding protein
VTKGTLTVSVYVTPPYTEKDGDGYKGVDTELIKKIAEKECLKVSFQEVAAAGLIQSVQSKRADTALGGIYRTPERAKTLELSATAYRDGMVLLAKEKLATLAQLKSKTVGVIQGYLWTADLQKALGQGGVKIYQSSDGMINDLKNGRLDVAVLTNAEAAYRIKQSPDLGLVATQMESSPKVAASQHPGEVVFPSPKGNTAQANAFSADIKQMVKDGTVVKILKEYGMPASASPAQ